MSSEELARRIIECAQEKKGHQIVLMNISKLTTIADYFVIVSGDSPTQVKAITDHIYDELRDLGVRPRHKEGYQYLNWVLLDYIDVIVHVLQPRTREFYAIERLWADAEMEYITEEVA
ncbi:MAG TPA: ribosome silencing factor [Calditrichaeota bacterium]|nr:ribosome silencing factor [Calditrichota bacterium]